MENNLMKSMADGFQVFTDLSVNAMKATLENSASSLTSLNRNMGNMNIGNISVPFIGNSKTDCCPPRHECPPNCILEINREAYPGERIVVPFLVKNNCKEKKAYKVGVRELKNIDGTNAPTSAILNKSSVTLDSGQSELVLMQIDLGNLSAGQNFQTEIVIREKEYNQNICFSLKVKGYGDAPVAEPEDEKKYKMRWQSWKSHFYCEPSSLRG